MAPQSAATTTPTPHNIASVDERRQWLVLATLFIVLFFALGGTINPLPVFLTPLIKQYGWSHARVSWVPTVYLLMFGLGAPVIGWLMDRFEARIVMSIGALVGRRDDLRQPHAFIFADDWGICTDRRRCGKLDDCSGPGRGGELVSQQSRTSD